jgi:hypothetical protein
VAALMPSWIPSVFKRDPFTKNSDIASLECLRIIHDEAIVGLSENAWCVPFVCFSMRELDEFWRSARFRDFSEDACNKRIVFLSPPGIEPGFKVLGNLIFS